MSKIKKTKFIQGFTLVEFLIYITIVSFAVGLLTLTAVNILEARAKVAAMEEINRNARFLMEKITYAIRHAEAVISATENSLVLEMSLESENPTQFILEDGAVKVIKGSGEEAEEEVLTSDKVFVNSLNFSQPEGEESGNVVIIEMEIQSGRQGDEFIKKFSAGENIRKKIAETSSCKSNGAVCSSEDDCCSGYCVDGVCCNSACDGTCQACVASKTDSTDGTCANITNNTDPDNECDGICKVCQSGACGNATAGTDPKNQCSTASPPDPGSCKSETCSGEDYGCGYLAAGEQNQPACKRCNGSSYDPVNITDNTGDSEGINRCDADSGDCYRCYEGSCTYQTAGQDLFNECPGYLGSCAAATCSGEGYYCGYLTGQQSCPTCKYCNGSNYSCINAPECENCYGCTGSCKWCNGSGVCKTCSLELGDPYINTRTTGTPQRCKPSTSGQRLYLMNDGAICSTSLYPDIQHFTGAVAWYYICTCQ